MDFRDYVERGLISGNEARYLSKLAEFGNQLLQGADLKDLPRETALEKKAAHQFDQMLDPDYTEEVKEAAARRAAGAAGKQVANAGKKAVDAAQESFFQRNKVPIITGLIGGGLALPYVERGAEAVLDPVIENRRYNRMMSLEGRSPIDQMRQNLNPGGSVSGGTDEDAVMADFFIPEDLDPEERREQLNRKLFGIMHRYAPEITRTPELARSHINTELKGRGANLNPSTYATTLMQAEKGIDESMLARQRARRVGLSDLGDRLQEGGKALTGLV